MVCGQYLWPILHESGYCGNNPRSINTGDSVSLMTGL